MTKQEIIIGCIIYNNSLIKKILDKNLNLFIDDNLILIAKEIIDRYKKNKSFDLISLTESLKNKISATYLSGLIDNIIYENSIDSYLKDLEDDFKVGLLRIEFKKFENKQIDKDQLKQNYSQIIKESDNINSIHEMKNILQDYICSPDDIFYESGIKFIDENMGGWSKASRMIVIAARPGCGKTTFLNNIILKQLKNNIEFGFFSSEMAKREIIINMLSNSSGINSQKLRIKSMLTKVELERLSQIADRLYSKILLIDDTPNIDIMKLEDRCESMIKKGCKMLSADYLQILNCKLYERLPIRERINFISMKIKELSRLYDLPFFILAQLNRDAENKEPQLKDLKESGQIEQDGDMIIFLNPIQQMDINGNPFEWLYEIIIAKNKFGATGKFKMRYQKDICRFLEY